MKDAHKDMGLQTADVTALVEDLEAAMRAKRCCRSNRLLAKPAPMRRDVIK